MFEKENYEAALKRLLSTLEELRLTEQFSVELLGPEYTAVCVSQEVRKKVGILRAFQERSHARVFND